jgi:7 transmembrane receptor (rhodopsin family)
MTTSSTSDAFNVTKEVLQTLPGPTMSSSIIILSSFLFIFAVVSAVSNLLVLLSYTYDKKLRSNFSILIVNQAVADLIVSVIPMTLYTVSILVGYWPLGRLMCGVWVMVDYIATLASVSKVFQLFIEPTSTFTIDMYIFLCKRYTSRSRALSYSPYGYWRARMH